MKPSMGKDCTGLNLGTMYCLSTLKIGIFAPSENDVSPSPTSTKAPFGSGTPTPIQNGIAAGCTKFYKVISGDGCWAISNANSIALTDFYAWNPAVGSDCQNL
ncbi:hypothetical protein GGP41_003868 [Bipolaris sorokiniana]|uniref:LysM domain-containing protein n=2 Tax=Cochliobolus sativus TaxID=45130 RepID=A0A8H5ZDW8_COCSA|nr:carbohydrate-binding module family 50 protein [Bipolaris sorokiniana ND90Pr]EMD65234.1 carbohydrate-binding module family 50 protein [Bipolaris sorokiniana ND90Pr]KAF5846454.1 hypothetical protein GGP41_003868 [Bipolaris sorokiniana]